MTWEGKAARLVDEAANKREEKKLTNWDKQQAAIEREAVAKEEEAKLWKDRAAVARKGFVPHDDGDQKYQLEESDLLARGFREERVRKL
jgi:hypothetical protein